VKTSFLIDLSLFADVINSDVSRLDEEVHVYVFERLQNEQADEVFLGYLTIKPPRKHNETIDEWFT
jgi:hypothetical protein